MVEPRQLPHVKLEAWLTAGNLTDPPLDVIRDLVAYVIGLRDAAQPLLSQSEMLKRAYDGEGILDG